MPAHHRTPVTDGGDAGGRSLREICGEAIE
jgi:hypothetical protein